MRRIVVSSLQHSTSLTAGLPLRVAQLDWQVTKALAVMKSYSVAKSWGPTGWEFFPYWSVSQTSSFTLLFLFTSGGAEGDEKRKSLHLKFPRHLADAEQSSNLWSRFGQCFIKIWSISLISNTQSVNLLLIQKFFIEVYKLLFEGKIYVYG